MSASGFGNARNEGNAFEPVSHMRDRTRSTLGGTFLLGCSSDSPSDSPNASASRLVNESEPGPAKNPREPFLLSVCIGYKVYIHDNGYTHTHTRHSPLDTDVRH